MKKIVRSETGFQLIHLLIIAEVILTVILLLAWLIANIFFSSRRNKKYFDFISDFVDDFIMFGIDVFSDSYGSNISGGSTGLSKFGLGFDETELNIL